MTRSARCPWCWGSHGCDLPDGHDGDHECRAGHVEEGDEPDTQPRGHVTVFRVPGGEPESLGAVEANAAIQRARVLHAAQHGRPRMTCVHCGQPWPCPTIQALNPRSSLDRT